MGFWEDIKKQATAAVSGKKSSDNRSGFFGNITRAGSTALGNLGSQISNPFATPDVRITEDQNTISNLFGGRSAGPGTKNIFGVGQDPTGGQNELLQNVGAKERDQTIKDYQASTSDGSIDQTTGNQVADILNSGDYAAAARLLSQAKEGKGIYAVRKINENQKKILGARPGRAQLSQRYSLLSYN